MTNERKLYLIDKAIGNLEHNDGDSYGFTPIDFMRKNGVKDVNGMCIFLDSVGAYLEELRQGILAEIETESAKKNGKSTVLSEIKKRAKEAYNKSIQSKPQLAYADYDEKENVYFMLNGYWLIVTENPDGMNLMPERVKHDIVSPFNWKKAMPDISEMHTIPLPSIGKVSAYLKQRKALNPKKSFGWDKIILADNGKLFGLKGEWLESFMKITGATEIYCKDVKHGFVLTGNGYRIVIMPIEVKAEDNATITDFENI